MKHLKQITFICILAIMAIITTACAQTQTVSEMPATQTEPVQMQTKAVLETYKKILHNESSFIDKDDRAVYLHDLNFSLFAVLDMKMYKDGIPELILNNTSNGDTLVLHYYNGEVYGKVYGYRAMGNLKNDGFFYWSNSAFNSGIGVLHITGRDQEIIDMAEYGSLMEEIEMYRINGNAVRENDFYAYTAAQDTKEDVVWHELTIENINNLDRR